MNKIRQPTPRISDVATRKPKIICSALLVLGFLLTVMPRWAAATGYVELFEITTYPSDALTNKFNQLGALFICVDDSTWQLLSCPYTYQLVGVDQLTDPLIQNQVTQPLTDIQIYGGHEHDQSTHPFYWAPSPVVQSPITVTGGFYQYQTPLMVTGNTASSVVSVTFPAPETAGSIWEKVDIGSPPGWYCVGLCWTSTDNLYHDTYLIGWPGFLQLNPAATVGGPTNYIVVRKSPITGAVGGDTLHPDQNATWGDAYTIVQLELIANIYQQNTGDQLSINDMSLPLGGLFDVYADTTIPPANTTPGTWVPPHRGHRIGFAFDVNTTDAAQQPVVCDKYSALGLAIQEFDRLISLNPALLQPSLEPQLHCESGGRIHINAVDETSSRIIIG
jgi:hypothetical protein